MNCEMMRGPSSSPLHLWTAPSSVVKPITHPLCSGCTICDDEIELNFHLLQPHWAMNALLNRSSECLPTFLVGRTTFLATTCVLCCSWRRLACALTSAPFTDQTETDDDGFYAS